MSKQHGRHGDPSHFANIFMSRDKSHHHADGGLEMGSLGNMPTNGSHYKKGGKTRRRSRHAEGEAVSPITDMKSPDIIARRRGGRACHAEGDIVAKPYRRGGDTRKRRKRHAEGGPSLYSSIHAPFNAPVGQKPYGGSLFAYSRGGSTSTPHKRRHHDEGDSVEAMSHGGRKKKSVEREHHSFGDFVGNALSTVGSVLPYALPFFLKKGGSADAMKLAAGGAGKVRKGMLSKSGKIINNKHNR